MRSAGWFGLVMGLGGAQAALSVASAAMLRPEALSGPAADGIAGSAVAIVASILLPYLAYAADSSRMLAGSPRASPGRWQAVGGLLGMVLSLGLLHTAVLLTGDESSGVMLVYRLVLPPFVVGCLGAAPGALFALAAHRLLHHGA